MKYENELQTKISVNHNPFYFPDAKWSERPECFAETLCSTPCVAPTDSAPCSVEDGSERGEGRAPCGVPAPSPDDLAARLRAAEARCASLERLLADASSPESAFGPSLPPLRADAATIPLAAALVERRLEYPATSPLGRARFESFGWKLLATVGPDALLRDITRERVESVLATCVHPCTWNGLRATARAFFRWCIRRRLLRISPVDGIDPRPEPRHEPHFHAPDAVRRIFQAATARDTDPAVGAFLTLGFFCGMRTSEIRRAVRRDIDLVDGTVRVPVPKGYWRGTPPRLIQARPNAIAWLRYFLPPGLPPDAPVAASPHVLRKWKDARLAPLGLSWGRDTLRNVMRHTACTMHVAAFRNLAETQLMLGHSAGSDITVRHYLGLASRRMGEEYWAIVPPHGLHPAARTAAASSRRSRAAPVDGRFLEILLDDDGTPLSAGPGRAAIRPDGSVDFGSDVMPP